MMRKLFFVSTACFWLAVAGFWSSTLWLPEELAGPGAVAADKSAKADTTVNAERSVTLAELARHAQQADCWMAINGQVYDFTAYMPQHPAEPSLMLAWCGKEASEAYRTKTKGRPHSPYADQLLPKYRIGLLAAAR